MLVLARVTMVRETHEVKLYQRKPKENVGGNGGITIVTGDNSKVDKSIDTPADYTSVLCNGISCVPPPKPDK